MSEFTSCPECGVEMEPGANFCTQCGHSLASSKTDHDVHAHQETSMVSEKVARTALLLALFLGPLGAHRFYVGKIGTGILMLLTGGGLGIWALIDLVLIASCEFKDVNGKVLEFQRGKGSSSGRVIKIIGVVFAAIVLYVTGLIMLLMMFTSGLVGAVQGQLEAIRQGDLVKAYAYTSKDFQTATSLDAFKQFVHNVPALENNESATFTHRERVNNQGLVKGTLTGKDGSSADVEYQLIQEEEWKILGIQIIPPGAKSDTTIQGPTGQNVSTLQTFNNAQNRYLVQYPTDWTIEQPDSGTVVFVKYGANSEQPQASVNIQTILTKKAGGLYKTIDDGLKSMTKQAQESLAGYELLDKGEVELPKNPSKYKGGYIVFKYTYQGKEYKQMVMMLDRGDGKLFYSFGYTSTMDSFDTYLPLTQTIFESWEIK